MEGEGAGEGRAVEAIAIASPAVGVRASLYRWLNRYGVAEAAGIACALAGSVVVRRATGSAIFAAYAAAWGESIGYSVVMVGRDFVAEARTARATRRAFGVRGAGGVVASLLAEFGPAGVLDTFVTRPLAMAVGARLLGPRLGVLAGKLGADFLFYVPVIFVYERRRRWRRPTVDS
jgi:hypothetical protein